MCPWKLGHHHTQQFADRAPVVPSPMSGWEGTTHWHNTPQRPELLGSAGILHGRPKMTCWKVLGGWAVHPLKTWTSCDLTAARCSKPRTSSRCTDWLRTDFAAHGFWQSPRWYYNPMYNTEPYWTGVNEQCLKCLWKSTWRLCFDLDRPSSCTGAKQIQISQISRTMLPSFRAKETTPHSHITQESQLRSTLVLRLFLLSRVLKEVSESWNVMKHVDDCKVFHDIVYHLCWHYWRNTNTTSGMSEVGESLQGKRYLCARTCILTYCHLFVVVHSCAECPTTMCACASSQHQRQELPMAKLRSQRPCSLPAAVPLLQSCQREPNESHQRYYRSPGSSPGRQDEDDLWKQPFKPTISSGLSTMFVGWIPILTSEIPIILVIQAPCLLVQSLLVCLWHRSLCESPLFGSVPTVLLATQILILVGCTPWLRQRLKHVKPQFWGWLQFPKTDPKPSLKPIWFSLVWLKIQFLVGVGCTMLDLPLDPMVSLLHHHHGTAIAGRAAAALRRAGHAEGRARLGTAGDLAGGHLRQTSVDALKSRCPQRGHNCWGKVYQKWLGMMFVHLGNHGTIFRDFHFWRVVPLRGSCFGSSRKTIFQLTLVMGQPPGPRTYSKKHNVYTVSVRHVPMANRFWDLWRRPHHPFVLEGLCWWNLWLHSSRLSGHVWKLQLQHQGSWISSLNIKRFPKSFGYPQQCCFRIVHHKPSSNFRKPPDLFLSS